MIRAIHHRSVYPRYYGLTALGFLFGISYGIFSLTIPLLAEKIFPNLALLSFVYIIPEIIGVVFDVPLGAFANRFGRRRVILLSGLLLGVTAIIFTLSHNPFFFILPMIFYGFATQAYIIPADAELVALSPNTKTGKFNGFVEGVHNFGYSLGSILAGMLLAINFQSPFFLILLISIAMIVISVFFFPPEDNREGFLGASRNVARRDGLFKSSFSEFRKLGFLGMFLAFLFFVFALHWGFVALMEPLYTNALNLNSILIGLIYAGFTIPLLLVSMLVGRYIDRRGAKRMVISGLILMAISTIGFGLTQAPIVLFILSLMAGIGDAFLLPAIMSAFDQLSSYHAKERISGVKILAESSGYLLGPLLGGIGVSFLGFESAFIALGGGILVFVLATPFVSFRVSNP